jgi:kinesin family member 3B
VWDEDADEWSVRHLEVQSNRLRVRRPPSCIAPASALLAALSMPEARPKVLAGSASNDPGFKSDNIAALELEMPTRTTEDYDGGALKKRIPINSAVKSTLAGSRPR